MNERICPKCDEALGVDKEWVITDRSLIGTKATGEEGVYAHADCLE